MNTPTKESYIMKTKYSKTEILNARNYWRELSPVELLGFWKHYTTGSGRGSYLSVEPSTSFLDFLVASAAESSFCQTNDI
jgi:hypothetical protein